MSLFSSREESRYLWAFDLLVILSVNTVYYEKIIMLSTATQNDFTRGLKKTNWYSTNEDVISASPSAGKGWT